VTELDLAQQMTTAVRKSKVVSEAKEKENWAGRRRENRIVAPIHENLAQTQI